MDRGPWWATIHRVAKSQTQLKRLPIHAQEEEERFSSSHCSNWVREDVIKQNEGADLRDMTMNVILDSLWNLWKL